MQNQLSIDLSPVHGLAHLLSESDPAPWWGVPVIAGAFLIIGGALGFWFNWLLEGRKQSRVEAVRWDADIRLIAAELLGAIRDCVRERINRDAFAAGQAWALQYELQKKSEADSESKVPENLEYQIRRIVHASRHDAPFFQESEQRTHAAWERIESLTASLGLVAPEPVWAAAETLVLTAQRELSIDEDSDLTPKGRKLIVDAREDLINAVRQHLGLPKFSGATAKS